ncbi:MAG: carbohydrate binding domain-containing protein, partial [Bacteroidaceae bacterium]|nr:carbohydrate binding domain-containing protein [Bacteroidaceae bacterium]
MCALVALSMAEMSVAQGRTMHTSKPDSVYLMSYTTTRDYNRSGLHFAYSPDGDNWLSIGNGRAYLKSEYGAWNTQKRMLTPWVTKGQDGWWHCVWSVNETSPVFAHASSPNLIDWYRQSFPNTTGMACERPVLTIEGNKGVVTYMSGGKQYQTTTTDYKNWSDAIEVNIPITETNSYKTIDLNNHLGVVSGNVQKVAWSVVDYLLKYHEHRLMKDQLNGEQVMIPSLEGLNPIEVNLTLTSPVKAKQISDELIGIFFEDLNYAADGGIYAELVQNRGFEYDPRDTQNRWGWDHTTAWSLKNASEGDKFEIATIDPIHENNKHYAVLTISKPGVAFVNEGFDGIVLKKGDKYDFSLWARQLEGKGGQITIRLVDEQENIVGEKKLFSPSDKKWKQVNTVITAQADVTNTKLQI